MASEKTVHFWIKSQIIFEDICNKCDKTWQKRKRILSTKLLVIFIIKLVLSKNKQGYASSLLQLWDTCVEKGIQLPQTNSIAPSSLCEARQKLPESVFMDLNSALLEHWHTSGKTIPTWHGHKVFAVDGSKINLPRGLLNYGYTTAKDRGRYYPQGTMSCLYNLREQIASDFTFVSHGDERACAIEHFKHVDAGDIKNCILVVARYLENLILAPHNLIITWINKAICSIARIKQRVRPGRSYQRISHKPRGKWDSFRTVLKA